jgi:TolB-like protein
LAVIVLSPLKFDATDRQVAGIAGDITDIFAKTLSRIAEAIVITPASPGKLPALPKDSYRVEVNVQRVNSELRINVRLFDHGSGELVFHGRPRIGIDTLAPIAEELEAGLIPALQSKIGRDQKSN